MEYDSRHIGQHDRAADIYARALGDDRRLPRMSCLNREVRCLFRRHLLVGQAGESAERLPAFRNFLLFCKGGNGKIDAHRPKRLQNNGRTKDNRNNADTYNRQNRQSQCEGYRLSGTALVLLLLSVRMIRHNSTLSRD